MTQSGHQHWHRGRP